jgi:hypothetical protein
VFPIPSPLVPFVFPLEFIPSLRRGGQTLVVHFSTFRCVSIHLTAFA